MQLVSLWLASIALALLLSLLLQYFANPIVDFADFLHRAGGYLLPFLLAFAATAPIAVHLILRFTHRFAGPIVRLRSEMAQLAAGGSPPPIRFREKDYWQDLAGNFNQIAGDLEKSRRRVNELESQLKEMSAV